MDVVYILKSNESNEELRHSLRSLVNLPHDRVWIAGHKPRWMRGVGHIPVRQASGSHNKHPNSIANQRAALAHPDVSDPFLLFNDDFYVMHPQDDGMPVLNWGRVDDVIEHYGKAGLGRTFHKSMIFTRKILADLGHDSPLSYQLHVPLVVHKDAFAGAMDLVDGLDVPEGTWPQHATIYGNTYGLGGTTLARDVKVHTPDHKLEQWMLDSPFLSSGDTAFHYGPVGEHIRARFPDKCAYEA